MAAGIEQPQRYDQVYFWVRCVCGNGLWKRFPDHLEMTVSPRGRQKRTIRVSFEAAPTVSVICEKCDRENVPAVAE